MSTSASHSRILAALTAISLSACTPAPGNVSPSPTPSASPPSAPSSAPLPTGSATPSIARSLVLSLKADAGLAGFATAQTEAFSLCLGRIAGALTQLELPSDLSAEAQTRLKAAGAILESRDKGVIQARFSHALNLASLLAGLDLTLQGLPAATLEGRTIFTDAAGLELGFVSWRIALDEADGRVGITLTSTGETQAGESCPRIGASFSGAGGELGANQPLPNPQSSPSPEPGTSTGSAPGLPLTPRVVEQTSSSITLQWGFHPDARSHALFLDGVEVASGHVTPNYYRFTGLRANTTYRLGVQSVNGANRSEIVTISSATISGRAASGNFNSSGGSPNRPRSTPTPTPTPFEFIVNNTTSLAQLSNSVAMDAEGNFVVVWVDQSVQGQERIRAQHYNAEGVEVGSEFQVNAATLGTERFPDVAMNADGDFVVTWAAVLGDGGEIQAAVFEAGETVGDTFVVNPDTSGEQFQPRVSLNDAGNFVISWTTQSLDGMTYGVYGRRYDAGGTLPSSAFTVAESSVTLPQTSDIAMNNDGDFVVTWSNNPDFTGDVYGRYYEAGSITGGAEVLIHDATTGTQRKPAVAMDADGDFVVTWESNVSGSSEDVMARHFSAGFSSSGSEFRVNSYTLGAQIPRDIAMDDDGDFLITWSSPNQPGGSGIDVYVKRFEAGQSEGGDEQLVNLNVSGAQSNSSVAMDEDGDYVITWDSYFGQPGDDYYAVVARLFRQP
ncbi:MAG: fibronectin type III domain-containing protein [Candidatus Sericytochromatia bacterium]